ncbi:hypothetical protein D3C71_1398130 [compost metagenome]
MRVERAALIAFGHGVHAAEVHHVQGAARADIRRAGAGHGAQAVFRAGQYTAEQEVADFGRGQVQHSGKQAAVQELFHRLSARARGVKHQAVVTRVQQRRHLLHASGRDAEHGDAHGGAAVVVASGGIGGGHAMRPCDGARRVGQHAA